MYSIFITLYKFEEKLDKTKPSKAKDTFKIFKKKLMKI